MADSSITPQAGSFRRKAAILIASLDQELAARIMQELSADALRAIAVELRRLDEIPKETQIAVFDELARFLDGEEGPRGGEDVARKLLVEVVGEKRANEILESWGDERPFSDLNEADPNDLARILDKEQPAVSAMVLSHLSPQKMAEVISLFPPDLGQRVVVRLACQRQETDSKVVEQVEKVLLSKVLSVGHRENAKEKNHGPRNVAEMLQHMERSREEELLEAIRAVSEERAEEVRELMFTFEDLANLPDEAIQLILRKVPVDKLALALRGAPAALVTKINRNLSSNARNNLQEESALLGKVKLSVVEEEQRNVVQIVHDLEEEGSIDYRSTSEEEVYV